MGCVCEEKRREEKRREGVYKFITESIYIQLQSGHKLSPSLLTESIYGATIWTETIGLITESPIELDT
jgi:hypothetical protein